MLFTAMLGIMPAAEGEAAKLEITHANLEFASNVYLLVAVNYTGVCADESEALEKVYITVGGDKVTADAELTADEETPAGCVAFKYTNISAKEIGDIYEIAAFVDGEAEAQDTTTYSILEYAIKGKTTTPRMKAALEAMIAFGAAAQDAFEYEGDYDLAKTWGMVLFGGVAAENKKVFAEVGTPVTAPAADSATFPSGATLYDMSFAAVTDENLAVTEGIQRYFYYGQDVMGETSKFTSSATLSTDAGYAYLFNNLDFTNMTNGAQMKGSDGLLAPITVTGKTTIKQAKDTAKINEQIKSGSSFNVKDGNSNFYLWGIQTHQGAKSTTSTASVGMLNGYIYLGTPENTEDVTNYVSLYNYWTMNKAAFLDSNGKLTVSVTLAVDADTYKDTTILGRFIDKQSSNYNGSLWVSGIPKADIFSVQGGKVYAGDSTSDSLVSLRQVGSKWMKNDGITIHFVLDVVNKTVTAYNSLDGTVVVDNVTLATNFFASTSDDACFSIQVSGEAYISRIAVSEGDLFN